MEPNIVTVTPRQVTASPVALAALQLSETYRAEMESVRAARGERVAREERMTELAAKRAEAIRTALDEGMTQADVARILGVTAQAIHNVLRQH